MFAVQRDGRPPKEQARQYSRAHCGDHEAPTCCAAAPGPQDAQHGPEEGRPRSPVHPAPSRGRPVGRRPDHARGAPGAGPVGAGARPGGPLGEHGAGAAGRLDPDHRPGHLRGCRRDPARRAGASRPPAHRDGRRPRPHRGLRSGRTGQGRSRSRARRRTVRVAGGWVGALVGHPLHAGLGTAGAAVLFVALVVVAVLIATGVSLASFGAAAQASRAGHRARPGLVVAGEAAHPRRRSDTDDGAADAVPDEWPMPQCRPRRCSRTLPRRRTRPPRAEPGAEPVPHAGAVAPMAAMPTARAAGDWKLPELSILPATKQLRQDRRQLDAAGEDLVAALAAHGVTTRWSGARSGRR